MSKRTFWATQIILVGVICVALYFLLFRRWAPPLSQKEKKKKKGPKKKLLVLDINGFLVHREFMHGNGVADKYNIHQATLLGKHYTWKRPHVDEFLDFCFDNFTVAIWTSARKENMNLIADHVFGHERRSRLLEEFHQQQCNEVRPHPDPEVTNKPLFKKPLQKLWDLHPEYDKDNTLILENDPWKLIDNPSCTGFPLKKWTPSDAQDDALGPNSGLRTVLHAYATVDLTTQEFVEAISKIQSF